MFTNRTGSDRIQASFGSTSARQCRAITFEVFYPHLCLHFCVTFLTTLYKLTRAHLLNDSFYVESSLFVVYTNSKLSYGASESLVESSQKYRRQHYKSAWQSNPLVRRFLQLRIYSGDRTIVPKHNMFSLDSPSRLTVSTGFIIVVILYAFILRARRPRLPLPPGPPTLPLVGNLFDVPSSFQWKTYAQWAKDYDSDIIHLNVAGTSVIVLSTFEASDALFEKRSSIYSDRHRFPMVNELMGWHFNIGLMKYGDEWRTHRRLLNETFNSQTVRKFEPAELAGAHTLLGRLLHSPNDFQDHLRQMAGEIIMAVAYGIDALPTKDPYIALAHEAVRTFSIGTIPGQYLVDTFPILKYVPQWMPGAGFKRQAAEWSKLSRDMLELPFAETKRQMESGHAPPSFSTNSLQALEDPNKEPYYQEQHVKQVAAAVFVGGADTTVSAISTFILAMIRYPEIQKKAQKEIDGLTGGKYLPTFEDKAALPYITALAQEVMRWETVAPLALPRLLRQEDEYRGYRLPAGSVVFGNVWAILHDERVYPNPHTFKPERFLLDGKLNPAVRVPDIAFGFGRRRCPGRPLASSSIWITIASILATYDIGKARDEKGEIIEPSYEYIPGGITAPAPFECSFTPRSPEAIALIRGAHKGE
ncbi:cytochrome P450 [Favolaschia claudopus]|uniref:Cytochrome P450 n=1 Tax=Favolaschia claudopus TaxID=2862362 RepID=A0AAW0AYB4_9AGAR